MSILVGTDDGLYTLDEEVRTDLRGHKVGSLVADGNAIWALVDGVTIYGKGSLGIWRMRSRIVGKRSKLPRYDRAPVGTCIHPESGGGILVGTTEAHLLRVEADDDWVERVESFESVSGRDSWHTPAGDPPAVRSISADPRGSLYVNVHVGGVPKSSDNGDTWVPTIDVEADVHQVLATQHSSGRVYAATAKGLASSTDGGMTWDFRTEGLSGEYCRAVAANADHVFVAASSGPSGEQAGVHRGQLATGAFERCGEGLPTSFEGNIDTHCLTTNGSTVAFGTSDGRVFVSEDSGHSWREETSDLPAVRCLLIV